MQCDFKLAGRFKLVINGQHSPWYDNMVVDSGLDLLGTTNDLHASTTTCQVGTGTTPPAAGQTALASPLAISTGITATSDEASRVSPYWVGIQNTYSFGSISGDITELGVFGSSMFSRALLPDTVTILSGETLSVIYEIRVYFEEPDVPWSTTFKGVPTSGVIRPGRIDEITFSGFMHNGNCTATDGPLGVITESPSGNTAAGSYTLQAYTPGTFYRDVKLAFDETQGNQTISSLYTESSLNASLVPCYQISFNPPVPKTSTDAFNFVIRFTWSRR